MYYTCLDIQEEVLEKLQNDETLSAYVKKFDIGEENVSRKLFPYVNVASVTDEVEPLCIGPGAPDLHRFTIIISAGTYHMLPEISAEGNDAGKKGIVHLVDDIVAAICPGTINGIFKGTLHLVRATINEAKSGGGRSMTGMVIFRGIRKQ